MQPLTVYEATTQEDSIPPELNSTEVSLNTVQEITQPQVEVSNPPHSSLAELFYNTTRIANTPTPIQPVEPAPFQPVEPVIGLTPEEQRRREKDPNLTLDELLGLSSCEDQLNCIQSLQQIAPLHSTKDHLPKDIITILERLGKVENTPFDKLYYLAENCADRYYTSVIKTFIKIIKWNATDRQIVLVNTTRALKYLEDFGQR